MIQWWNIDQTLRILFSNFLITDVVFVVLICEILMFLDASVMIVWCFFEGSFMRQRWFWCKYDWSLSLFCAIIRNIDDSLLLLWLFVETTFMKHWRLRFKLWRTLMFGFCPANLRNIDISLLLQWYFVDASLSEPWWKSDDLAANNINRFCFFLC